MSLNNTEFYRKVLIADALAYRIVMARRQYPISHDERDALLEEIFDEIGADKRFRDYDSPMLAEWITTVHAQPPHVVMRVKTSSDGAIRLLNLINHFVARNDLPKAVEFTKLLVDGTANSDYAVVCNPFKKGAAEKVVR